MAYLPHHPCRNVTHPAHSPIYTFSDEPARARFATSSERSSLDTPPPAPATAAAAMTPRYDPLGVLERVSVAEQNRERIAALDIPRSAPHEVASGVMSDGRWNIYHPAVQTCLSNPPPRPNPKQRAAASIYTLAALSIRLSPLHAAYNDFWNPDIRDDTAQFIDRVLSTEPRLIDTYPYTWFGSHEMVWQLKNFNPPHERVRDGEFGISPSPNNRKMSLRKRKATKAAPPAQTGEAAEGQPEPPRKRARKTKPTPKAAAALAAAAVANAEATPVKPTAATAGASLAPPTKTSPKARSPLGAFSPITASVPLADDEGATSASAIRGRTENKGEKRDSVDPTSSTPTSARRPAHDRSPSTSETSTATSSMAADLNRGRSSSSTSSSPATPPGAAQAVDAKGKGKAVDVPELTETMGESAEPEAHTTRARTRAAAKRGTVEPEPAPAPDADAMQTDDAEAPATKRNRAATDAASAPLKRRKRTAGVTRARTTRRR